MSDESVRPAASDPNVGRVVAGRYSILRRLGGGGMGVVYLAEHTAIQKRVALKLLHAHYATDPGTVQRFLNEARAAAMIGHRNIVDALDFGQAEDGAPFLVLEYLEGHDLAHELEAQGRVSARRAAEIGLQIAAGLGAAHKKGIVHRDLKPDNVFLVEGEPPDSAVRILDFGISKIVQGNSSPGGTQTGAVMGTPSYMAPEQFLDASRVDARCDVYALGVLLFQMLAGRVPFSAPSFGALALVVMQEKAPSVGSLRPDLPPSLVSLIDAMLAKDPAQRPATMADVSAVLAPLAHGGPDIVPDALPEVAAATGPAWSGAARSSAAPIAASPPDSRRLGLALAAIAGALVLVGLAWVGMRPPAEPAPGAVPVRSTDPSPTVGEPARTPEPDAATATPAVPLPLGAIPPEVPPVSSDLADDAGAPALDVPGSALATERTPGRRRPPTPPTPPTTTGEVPRQDERPAAESATTMETTPGRTGPSRRLDDENPY